MHRHDQRFFFYYFRRLLLFFTQFYYVTGVYIARVIKNVYLKFMPLWNTRGAHYILREHESRGCANLRATGGNVTCFMCMSTRVLVHCNKTQKKDKVGLIFFFILLFWLRALDYQCKTTLDMAWNDDIDEEAARRMRIAMSSSLQILLSPWLCCGMNNYSTKLGN